MRLWVDEKALSLGQYLVRLFQEHGKQATELESFKNLEKYYGREKLRRCYEAAKKSTVNPLQTKMDLLTTAPKVLREAIRLAEEELNAELISIELKEQNHDTSR